MNEKPKFYTVPKMRITKNMCFSFLFSSKYFLVFGLLFWVFKNYYYLHSLKNFNLIKEEFFLVDSKCLRSSVCSIGRSFIGSARVIHIRVVESNNMLLFLPSFPTRDLLMFEMVAPSVTGE